MDKIINMLKAEGFQVYMRKPSDEYCYVTDGKHVAYVQWSDYRTSVSTVHKPNRTSGTGFSLFESISPENVKLAMVTVAPQWATNKERESAKKYKDWNEFHKADTFNSQLFQV